MGRRRQKLVDPLVAITTPGGRRSLGTLIHNDPAGALAAMTVLVDQPPSDPKQLAWLLAFAGRAALGLWPARPERRPEVCAAIDERFAWFVEFLRHGDDKIREAATLPIAASRAHAAAGQSALRAEKERARTIEMACSLQLAAGVLARESPSLFEPEASQVGQPSYHANVIARPSAHARELSITLFISGRSLSKTVWFSSEHEVEACVRARIRERPRAEREQVAIELLDDNKPARAVELVFEHREVMPRNTRDEQLRAMTFVRDPTPVQRRVLVAPIEKCRHVSQINYLCADYRIPHTAAGRASLVDDGAVASLADALAEATLDGRPAAIAIPDELRVELEDRDWFRIFFQQEPAQIGGG